MNIKVIVADDHAMYRECLKKIIEVKTEDIKVVGEAINGQDVLSMAGRDPVDIYIIDVTMPILNGIETTRKLLQQAPESKVIILSIHSHISFVKNALEAGARGYVLKEDAAADIIAAIRQVLSGHYYLSPKICQGYQNFPLHRTLPCYSMRCQNGKLFLREP